MRTAIGQRLEASPGRSAAAAVFGVLIVAADLLFAWRNIYPERIQATAVLAVTALAGQIWLVDGDLTSIGLRVTPTQGWWYWIRVTLIIGLAVAACIAVGQAAWVLTGHELPVYTTAPDNIATSFLRMCVYAPVLEETIYRLALCVPLTVLLGPWKVIALSGLVFGGLHIVAGNPSPENLVGGLFLAWSYLKSESIVVPVLLHSLGNLCALSAQVAAWYYFSGAG